MASGPLSVVSGPWFVARCRSSVVSGPWSVVRCRSSVVSGPWSVVRCPSSGEFAVLSVATDNGRRTTDNVPSRFSLLTSNFFPAPSPIHLPTTRSKSSINQGLPGSPFRVSKKSGLSVMNRLAVASAPMSKIFPAKTPSITARNFASPSSPSISRHTAGRNSSAAEFSRSFKSMKQSSNPCFHKISFRQAPNVMIVTRPCARSCFPPSSLPCSPPRSTACLPASA